MKWALLSTHALGLPDRTKPFHLYVDENNGVAKGVITQTLGPLNTGGLLVKEARSGGSRVAS